MEEVKLEFKLCNLEEVKLEFELFNLVKGLLCC